MAEQQAPLIHESPDSWIHYLRQDHSFFSFHLHHLQVDEQTPEARLQEHGERVVIRFVIDSIRRNLFVLVPGDRMEGRILRKGGFWGYSDASARMPVRTGWNP